MQQKTEPPDRGSSGDSASPRPNRVPFSPFRKRIKERGGVIFFDKTGTQDFCAFPIAADTVSSLKFLSGAIFSRFEIVGKGLLRSSLAIFGRRHSFFAFATFSASMGGTSS